MKTLSISEASSVQFPMVKHATEMGWVPLSPESAEDMRGSLEAPFFRDVLSGKLLTFNSWLSKDDARSIMETLEALPPTIEGNRELLCWLRGERFWHDAEEKRQRRV
ncbi:MAG: deoxyribonuclease HsdR, partial [Desulfovibrionaceae bacterium]|nr:deoxyribonuclease HsdR [Desulfovibrionaceae bacterium]